MISTAKYFKASRRKFPTHLSVLESQRHGLEAPASDESEIPPLSARRNKVRRHAHVTGSYERVLLYMVFPV